MCGLMRPIVCESVQGQGHASSGEHRKSGYGRLWTGEDAFGRPGERDGRCLVGSALKLGGLGPYGADKGWDVEADDSRREEERKELKGYLSGFNGL